PPKMNYRDDVQYPETGKLAVQKDIIINTVQCGNHKETQKYWQDICRKAEGSYVQIDARGGPVVVVETPFDKELAKINAELAHSTVTFGDGRRQMATKKRAKAAAGLPAAEGAERAAFTGRSGGGSANDLLENIKNKKVKLEELRKEELPPELQKLSLAEQKEFLEKLDKRRGE